MFVEFACAMAYVEVEDEEGGTGVGSAFHVGEGVFVTARHVVENVNIREIGSTETRHVPIGESEESLVSVVQNGIARPAHTVGNGVLSLKRGPLFHPDDSVDVAVFQVENIDPRTPVVRLGSHLDDWLGESDFVLTEAVIMGYPQIPKAKRLNLVGTRAEVSAMIDRYDAPHVHFILSAMARGGFSGGLVLSEYGYALGMVTSSLLSGNYSAELGYMTAVGVEPLYVCLAEHKMLPNCQADGWDEFWNTYYADFFSERQPAVLGGRAIVASIGLFDDGKRLALTIMCNDDQDVMRAALEHVAAELTGPKLIRTEVRPDFMRIDVDGPYDLYQASVQAAARSLVAFMKEQGYLVSSSSLEIS